MSKENVCKSLYLIKNFENLENQHELKLVNKKGSVRVIVYDSEGVKKLSKDERRKIINRKDSVRGGSFMICGKRPAIVFLDEGRNINEEIIDSILYKLERFWKNGNSYEFEGYNEKIERKYKEKKKTKKELKDLKKKKNRDDKKIERKYN